jgi:hypothetical protein
MSTPHRFVIDEPGRRSSRLRWRDHCLTLVLWAVWGDPIGALARLALGDRGISTDAMWATFVADLATMAGVAGLLVSLLLGWGAWGHLRAQVQPPWCRFPGSGPRKDIGGLGTGGLSS